MDNHQRHFQNLNLKGDMVGNNKLLFWHFLINIIVSYLKSLLSWECRRWVNFYCMWLPKQNLSFSELSLWYTWLSFLVVELQNEHMPRIIFGGKKGESKDDKMCIHPSLDIHIERSGIKYYAAYMFSMYSLCAVCAYAAYVLYSNYLPSFLFKDLCQSSKCESSSMLCRAGICFFNLTMTTIKSRFSSWERGAPAIIIPNLFSSLQID